MSSQCWNSGLCFVYSQVEPTPLLSLVFVYILLWCNPKTGKNAVHLLHPIFKIGQDEHAGQSPYQIALSKSKQSAANASSQDIEEDELDAEHHKARSLRRRASIKARLETGHSLSSTNVHWPQQEIEDEETTKIRGMNRAVAWEKRQTQRREWVHDRIEKGKALSDSTGGHWDEKQ